MFKSICYLDQKDMLLERHEPTPKTYFLTLTKHILTPTFNFRAADGPEKSGKNTNSGHLAEMARIWYKFWL